MYANTDSLTPTSGGAAPDTSHVFAWSLGEVRASLAVCPPAAFHVIGLRLERLGPDSWWGDLAGYRDDLGVPFVWPGFRVRRGRGWEIVLPVYLLDIDGVWRALIFNTLQRLVGAAMAHPASATAEALFIGVERPNGMPALGNVGGECVMLAERTTAASISLGKRYRFAAQRTRNRTVLMLGTGPGARMLARTAARVVAVDASRAVVDSAARLYRSPRLSFVTAAPGALPFASGSFDVVVGLEARALDLGRAWPEIERVLRPDGFIALAASDTEGLGRLVAALGEGFTDTEAWSQRRAQGRQDILEEFDLEVGVHPAALAFVVLARHRTGVVRPDSQARLRQGAELLAADRLSEAFTIFAEILRADPTSVGALVGAAHCALMVDDTRAARALLKRVLSQDPDHAGAQAALRELDAATAEPSFTRSATPRAGGA
jgi:SAM-dependent methyltransferase